MALFTPFHIRNGHNQNIWDTVGVKLHAFIVLPIMAHNYDNTIMR